MHSQVPPLYRTRAGGPVVAGDGFASQLRLHGFARVVGRISTDAPPAPGFPRVQQSIDGEHWEPEAVGTEGDDALDYLIDVPLHAPYVRIEWRQGTTGASYVEAWVRAVSRST